MDEQAIAARQLQNIPQESVAPSEPTVVVSDTPTDIGYTKDLPFDELTQYKLFQQFDIPMHQQSNPEITDKIALVYLWAANVTGSEDYLSVQAFFHNMDNMIGVGGTQSRLDRFYQYARLDLQRRRIEKEMQYA